MNKEPIALYILRITTSIFLLGFMVMLYWSSTLIEDQLKEVRSELVHLKSEVTALRNNLQRAAPLPSAATSYQTPKNVPSASNILKSDPFYEEVLSKMLGEHFVPSGTMRTATIGKPDNLHPFSQWRDVAGWVDLCSVSVARSQVGKYETFVPDCALSMEERVNPETGTPEYWVHLRDNIFWEPLKQSFFSNNVTLAPQFLERNQVTAEDFKLWYDAIVNPFVQLPGVVSLRTYYGDVEEVRVIDKFTFVVRWKTHDVPGPDNTTIKKVQYTAKLLTGSFKPLASFVYKYFADGKKIVEDDSSVDTYQKNSVWAQNFSEHWAKNIIVSCGPWVFDGMNDRQISFVRNTNFYDPLAALTDRIDVEFKATTDNIWQAFKANELIRSSLQPDQRLEFQDFLKSAAYKEQEGKGAAIKQIDYTDRIYAYIGWNAAKPLFSNKDVRRALTMAIDRKRIIEKNLNGMGVETNGQFYVYSPSYNSSIKPWPYNPTEAKMILEAQGWRDTDGDGVIDKVIDGVKTPFSFNLTYYVKNSTMKSIVEYVSAALKEIGIDCRPNGVDIADLSAVFDDKSFDGLYMMWALGTPPENVRQLWYSSGAKEKGSSNMVGFSNAEADKIIDALEFEYNPEERLKLYHRFSEILHDEQPYTFLFTPKISMIYREALQNVFLPVDRQDLIPGADVAEPISSIFWIKKGN